MNVWLQAIRPRTLPAGAIPVLVGTAAAHGAGTVRPLPALAALVGALLLQIAANLANDYHDWKNGADTEERCGPPRVTQQGLLPPAAVQRAYRLTLLMVIPVGVYLASIGGWPIIAIGLAGMICAVAYTGGPIPLGYLGLGDLLVFAFFGPIAVGGTYFLQVGHWDTLGLLAGVPVGLLATAILVVNNHRDLETDRLAGKRTLAVRLGRPTMRIFYGLLLLTSFSAPPLMIGRPGALVLLALPLAKAPLKAMLARPDGPSLNHALAQTARLMLMFGVLFSLALSAT